MPRKLAIRQYQDSIIMSWLGKWEGLGYLQKTGDLIRGSLIACSSVRAVTIEPGLAVYDSTKAAIGLLVKGFASEVGRFGVRVNAIAPSITETALTGPITQRPDIYNLYAGHTVFNRWSSADEVATAVAYLASDAASYVSGSTLFVDGA